MYFFIFRKDKESISTFDQKFREGLESLDCKPKILSALTGNDWEITDKTRYDDLHNMIFDKMTGTRRYYVIDRNNKLYKYWDQKKNKKKLDSDGILEAMVEDGILKSKYSIPSIFSYNTKTLIYNEVHKRFHEFDKEVIAENSMRVRCRKIFEHKINNRITREFKFFNTIDECEEYLTSAGFNLKKEFGRFNKYGVYKEFNPETDFVLATF